MAKTPLTSLARTGPTALGRAGAAASVLTAAGPVFQVVGSAITHFSERNRLRAETEQVRLKCETATAVIRYRHEVRMAELQLLNTHLANFHQVAADEMALTRDLHDELRCHRAWLRSVDSLQLLTTAQHAMELAQVTAALNSLGERTREVLRRSEAIVTTLAGSR